MKNSDKSALAFLTVGALVFWGLRDLPIGSFSAPGPGLFPLCVGSLLVLFSAVSFFASSPENLPKLSWELIPARILAVIGVLIAYRFGLPVFGHLLSTWLLFVCLLKIAGGKSWVWILAWSAVLTAASDLIFVRVLGVLFPPGILPF